MEGTRSSVRNPYSSFSRIYTRTDWAWLYGLFFLYTHTHGYILFGVWPWERRQEKQKTKKLCFLHQHALKSRRSTIALSCLAVSGVDSLALHFLEFRNKWFKFVYATDTLFFSGDRFLSSCFHASGSIYLSFYMCWKRKYPRKNQLRGLTFILKEWRRRYIGKRNCLYSGRVGRTATRWSIQPSIQPPIRSLSLIEKNPSSVEEERTETVYLFFSHPSCVVVVVHPSSVYI